VNGNPTWCLQTDYEAVLRTALGEAAYQQQCLKYPGTTKAIRARLIGSDNSTAIPAILEEALRWLAGAAGYGEEPSTEDS
jgi:hypothetical protein